jgi:hypothetical protein
MFNMKQVYSNGEKENNDVDDDDDTLKSRRLDDLCEHECNAHDNEIKRGK